jgi:hypothetical protein
MKKVLITKPLLKFNRMIALRKSLLVFFSLLIVYCDYNNSSVRAGNDIKALITGAEKTHPRLFFHRDDLNKIRNKNDSHQQLKEAFGHLLKQTDSLVYTQPFNYKDKNPIQLLASHIAFKRISYLAFAYILTENHQYLERAIREMIEITKIKSWNPSHFLDVAEMTAAMAIGYDWLYNDLPIDIRNSVKTAIIKNGLQPLFSNGNWWKNGSTNWTQVCYGGLVLGALAIMEDNPDLAARVLGRALNGIQGPMSTYGFHGGYAEGPEYWCYGTIYNVFVIDALRSVFNTDFGLLQYKNFMESARYFLNATDPITRIFNYGVVKTLF